MFPQRNSHMFSQSRAIVRFAAAAALGLTFIAGRADAQYSFAAPVSVNNDTGVDVNPVLAPGTAPGTWTCFYIANYSSFSFGGQLIRRRSTDGGQTWSAGVTVDSGPANAITTAHDKNGNIVVTWHTITSGVGVIRHIRSGDGGAAWGSVGTLTDSFGGGARYNPSVGTDESGNFVIAHQTHVTAAGGGNDYDVAVARSTNSGVSFSASVLIRSSMSSDSADDYPPRVCYAGSSTWVTAWGSRNTLGGALSSSYDHVLFSRSTDNGISWSAVAALSSQGVNPATYARPVTLASNGTGILVLSTSAVASPANSTSDSDLVIARSSNYGANWSLWGSVENMVTETTADNWPGLTYDSQGGWLLSWASQRYGPGADGDGSYSQSFDNGQSWTAVRAINRNAFTDTATDSFFPAAETKVDSAGNWLTAYVAANFTGADGDTVSARGIQDLATTASGLSFGEVPLEAGPAPTTGTVTIFNDGLSTLSVTSITITGGDAGEFSFTSPPSLAALAANTSRTLSVQFDPSSIGPKNAAVAILTDDPDGPAANLALSGTGIAPEITVTGGPLSFFGRGTDNGPSLAQDITVRNDGTSSLNFTGAGVALTGANAADFAFSPAPVTTPLAPGQSRTISVLFDRVTAGSKAAAIVITTDDSDESSINVPLSADAVEGFANAEDWQHFR